MQSTSNSRFVHGLLIGMVAAGVALVLHFTSALEWLESPIWNLRVRTFARPSPNTDKIRVILIDQASLNWGAEPERQWPWPWYRTIHGTILNFCKRGGARAVAFDMTFTEPSRLAGDDAEFVSAITNAKNFSTAVFISNSQGLHSAWPTNIPQLNFSVANLSDYLSTPAGMYRQVQNADFPIHEIAEAATMFGNVFATPERLNLITRMDPFHVFDNHFVPGLALSAYLAGNRQASLAIQKNALTVDGHTIPLDSSGRTILRYRGKSNVFPTVSAQAVIQSELRLQEGGTPVLDPEFFKDSYVFYGSSAIGLHDLKATPVDNIFPGCALHATFLDNLLTNDFLRDVPRSWVILLTILLAVSAGITIRFAATGQQMTIRFLSFLALPLIPAFIAYPLGWWLPVAILETAAFIALIWAIIANYAIEGRQKRFIKQAFGQYLSKEIIDKLILQPDSLKLGGEAKELTLFFSDIRGFTTISEALAPEQLTKFLNEFLTAMSDIVMDTGGTVDKYEGDCVIAFWNAPLDVPDHPAQAVRAALLCQKKLDELRPHFRELIGKEVYARIGINTGRVVIGNMGSARRFNYTFLGDAGNLASRLEGINKQFGTPIMISETTQQRLPDEFSVREIGRVRVVGKKEPVTVFEPMFREAYEARRPCMEAFRQGLQAFYAGRFAEAARHFDPWKDTDEPSAIYAERCRSLADNPPEPWEGILDMKEK